MTQHNNTNVKLLDSQLDKFDSATTNSLKVTLRLSVIQMMKLSFLINSY